VPAMLGAPSVGGTPLVEGMESSRRSRGLRSGPGGVTGWKNAAVAVDRPTYLEGLCRSWMSVPPGTRPRHNPRRPVVEANEAGARRLARFRRAAADRRRRPSTGVYGRRPAGWPSQPEPERGYEIPMVRAAIIETGAATLCICRGVKVLNVSPSAARDPEIADREDLVAQPHGGRGATEVIRDRVRPIPVMKPWAPPSRWPGCSRWPRTRVRSPTSPPGLDGPRRRAAPGRWDEDGGLPRSRPEPTTAGPRHPVARRSDRRLGSNRRALFDASREKARPAGSLF